jgi:hypothetical protein
MSAGANSTTGGEGSADPVLNSLMMRSPDLGDPVSLLERRVLYFISGIPLTQMHIALPRGQWRRCSNLRARGAGSGPHQTPAPPIDGRNPAKSESCESHKAAMMNVCGPGSQLREAKGVWPYLLLISDPAQRL